MFWEWHHNAPIIDVRLFKNLNFAVASLMMFFLGVLLFSSLVMMPQFLQTLMGYTAESAGLVLSGAGLVLLFEMPVVGQLTTKIPAKYIMAFGWLCLAVRHVLFHHADGSADQLPGGCPAADHAVFRAGLPVCTNYAGGLYWSCARKRQLASRD